VLKAFTRGFDETVNIVRGQISAGSVLGYSAAGTVVGPYRTPASLNDRRGRGTSVAQRL